MNLIAIDTHRSRSRKRQAIKGEYEAIDPIIENEINTVNWFTHNPSIIFLSLLF